MRQIVRYIVFVLAAVLLVEQSVSFAIEQGHGVPAPAATLAAEQRYTATQDSDGHRDGGSHCSYGCHLQSHFVGHLCGGEPIAFPEHVVVLPLTSVSVPLGITLEPPHRPPRFSPLS